MSGYPNDVSGPPDDILKETSERPGEATGHPRRFHVMVVLERRSRLLRRLLPPLILMLLGISFLVGRVIRPDGERRAANASDSGARTVVSAATPMANAETQTAPPNRGGNSGPPDPKNAGHTTEKRGQAPGPPSAINLDSLPDIQADIQGTAVRERARRAELERIKERERKKLDELAQMNRGGIGLADRPFGLIEIRPVTIDRLLSDRRESLQRELEGAVGKGGLAPGANDKDAFAPGTVLQGERNYRQGNFAGKTIQFELLVLERDGHKFTGTKFDKDPRRNHARVEGWVVGDEISWIEPYESAVLVMRGRTADGVTNFTFSGSYTNGTANVGDGRLGRPRGEGANREGARLESRAAELYSQGLRLSRQGKNDLAQGQFEQALGILSGLYPKQDHPSVLALLIELGMAHRQRGQSVRALDYYRQALEINKRLYRDQDHISLAVLLVNAGMALKDQGHFAQAMDHCRRSLEVAMRLFPRLDDGIVSTIFNDIGSVLSGQGEVAKALEYYRQGLDVNLRIHAGLDHPNTAKSLQSVAVALHRQGLYGEALSKYHESLSMKTRLYAGKDHPDVARSLSSIGYVLLSQRELEGASDYHGRALAMRERLYPGQDHPETARGLDATAIDHYALGKVTEGRAECLRALEMRERLYPREQYRGGHPEILDNLCLIAELTRSQGLDDQALPFVLRAVTMQETLSAEFLAGASETESLNFVHGLSSRARDTLISIAHRNPGVAASLYSSIWGSKGQVSRVVRLRQQALVRSADPATRAVGQDLLETRRQLADLLLTPADPSGEVGKAVQRLSSRKEDLERQLLARLPGFRGVLRLTSRRADELSPLLTPGCVFVDFFHYLEVTQDAEIPGEKGARFTPSLVAFLVRPSGEVTPVFLGPSRPIENAVGDWRSQIADAARPDSEATVSRRVLRSLLLDKLEPLFPAKTDTIVISPDSILSGLPWAALPGRNANEMLLENYALAIVSSGMSLLELREREREAGQNRGELLLVGAVDYDRPAADEVAPKGPNTPGSVVARDGRPVVWPSLEATRLELDDLVRTAGARPTVPPLTGSRASTTAVLALLPKARWAHLATHGFFADSSFRSSLRVDETPFRRFMDGGLQERFAAGSRSPLALSGLVLAGANLPRSADAFGVPSGDGGVLTAEAIAGLPLDTLELVVLSACESGLGEVERGEGVLGLQRAFHTAGARNVVASLWRVKSKATAALMKGFYNKLWAESKTPVSALREAQLELYRRPGLIQDDGPSRGLDLGKTDAIERRKGAPLFAGRAPVRLWAGFVLSGPATR